MSIIIAFPSLGVDVRYNEYAALTPEYDGITYSQVFEDKGISVNAVTTVPAQRWQITFDGLLSFEADPYSSHYALAVADLNTFSFTDKLGEIHTGVRYAKFSRMPLPHSKLVKIILELCKYPS